MRVVNTGTVSYQYKTPEKFLKTDEREKKKKYLCACLNKSWHLTIFFASVDILIGFEAEATLKRISIRLAQKWKDTYSRTCGYVKSRVVITLVRATHCCIRGGRVPVYQISVTRTQW